MSDIESIEVETNEDEVDGIESNDEDSKELLNNGSNIKVLFLRNSQHS